MNIMKKRKRKRKTERGNLPSMFSSEDMFFLFSRILCFYILYLRAAHVRTTRALVALCVLVAKSWVFFDIGIGPRSELASSCSVFVNHESKN